MHPLAAARPTKHRGRPQPSRGEGLMRFAGTLYLSIFVVGVTGSGHSAPAESSPASQMPQMIEQFRADESSLTRTYPLRVGHARMVRMEAFDQDKLRELARIDFDRLGAE